MREFAFDTAVAIDDGRGAIHDGWDINGNANGGYLLALAVNGLRRLAGRPDPVTVTAHYLAPGKPGPVVVAGEVVKQGKRFATVAGSVRSADRVLLQLVATFGELAEAHEPLYMAGGPPDLPTIEQCVPRVSSTQMSIGLMDKTNVLLRPSDTGFMDGAKSGVAEMAGWFSFADGRPLDTLALMLAADSFAPAVFNLDIPVGWVPTVELTVHVRAVPAPGPVRCMFRTRFIHSGMFEEDGEVWDSSGTLVALSRQLALLPR